MKIYTTTIDFEDDIQPTCIVEWTPDTVQSFSKLYDTDKSLKFEDDNFTHNIWKI